MDDIDVRDVQVAINPDDQRQVEFAITYAISAVGLDAQLHSVTLSTMTAG
jgi:hypothetical protein